MGKKPMADLDKDEQTLGFGDLAEEIEPEGAEEFDKSDPLE